VSYSFQARDVRMKKGLRNAGNSSNNGVERPDHPHRGLKGRDIFFGTGKGRFNKSRGDPY